ncbi:hypothetical protein BDV93DRAFT_562022 [Ceratobasidium sp. AG-I]|nr:hypothetical protein BDV93DRAFT_562022 [Ceratobasidium sp. AG-I]
MLSKHTKDILSALHDNATCLRHPDRIGTDSSVQFWSHNEEVVVVGFRIGNKPMSYPSYFATCINSLQLGLPDELPHDQHTDTLKLARQHNFIVERMVTTTADLIAKKAIKELSPFRGPLPSAADISNAPTTTELRLVKSVERLLFNQEAWQTAIHQNNAVLRYTLRKDSSNNDRELLGYVEFFGVWGAVPLLADLTARDPGENRTKAEKKG